MVEGIAYRYRVGIWWRDSPERFGPWQAVCKHHRFAVDGNWEEVLAKVLTVPDAAGELDWAVSVDSTVARFHQHGATAARHRGRCPSDAVQVVTGEPSDHGIGRSRDGLTTKVHALVDGYGRPLVLAVSPGQGCCSPMLPVLQARLRDARAGLGQSRRAIRRP